MSILLRGVRAVVRRRPRSAFALLLIGGAFAGTVAAYSAPPSRSPLPANGTVAREPIVPLPAVDAAETDRAALGHVLFESRLLSRRADRSCASCHDVSTNGATGNAKDARPDGTMLPRNTNTVFNAALSYRLNWMGTAKTLEQQAELVLLSPDLMGANWPELLDRLKGDAALSASFQRAYDRPADRDAVLDALAAYERTLLTPDSRFDLWLRGDPAAITERERDGYRLFKSLGCVSCHQGVNVGANLSAPNGVFGRLQSDAPRLMRVPSLRNVATTPPYFHDASAPTLEDAVRRMAKAQLGLELDAGQVEAITLFLGTLTGKHRGTPVSAPPRS